MSVCVYVCMCVCIYYKITLCPVSPRVYLLSYLSYVI